MGVELEHLRFLELQYLNAAFLGVDFIDGSEVFGVLRLNKDDEEVAKMRHAAMIAQEALWQPCGRFILDHGKEVPMN